MIGDVLKIRSPFDFRLPSIVPGLWERPSGSYRLISGLKSTDQIPILRDPSDRIGSVKDNITLALRADNDEVPRTSFNFRHNGHLQVSLVFGDSKDMRGRAPESHPGPFCLSRQRRNDLANCLGVFGFVSLMIEQALTLRSRQ